MIILIICTVLKILAVVVPLLISVAYFTIAERKIMGIIQRRKGPNVIGFFETGTSIAFYTNLSINNKDSKLVKFYG